jgi:TetR/AcrR family transcriptional repressor of lmrAB and yxaGH operons
MSPREAVSGLLDVIESNLIRGDMRPGCPFVAIAFAADDDEGRLRHASDAFFTRVRAVLSDCLMRAGVDPADADACAALAVSASEGAIVLSRARQDIEPFEATRRALLDHVDRLTGGK